MSLYEFLFGFSDETKRNHPHLFVHNNIDRHKCHRVVPMKVLCLSMGRTGTATMKAALEQLGYPTSHGFDLHENPRDAEMWNEAVQAKWYGNTSTTLDRTFWDKLLGHVSAVTDLPANMFGPELMAAYPDAKVILVERDVEKWYPSFDEAVIKSQELPIVNSVLGQLDPKIKIIGPLLSDGTMRGQFHASDVTEWRKNAKQVYKEHYADLRELLKDQPDRLLNFELARGWAPLCQFLGEPVPDAEFPRVNEAAQHREMIKIAVAQVGRTIAAKLILLVAPVVVGGILWRLRR